MYIVTICCSKRFKKEERAFAQALRKLGVTVFEPPLRVSPLWEKLDHEDRMVFGSGVTLRHFEKIQKADAVFIYNKDNYMGPSTNMEIGYAAALHKRIFFLEKDADYPRSVLAEAVITTPHALLKQLQSGKGADIIL